jgi:thioester reductase-like protein
MANLERYGSRPALEEGRLTVLAADLGADDLGLQEDDRRRLAAEADTIIHAAAEVKFTRGYSALRNANVLATRRLLDLALEGRTKAFHHVSTIGVLPPAPGAHFDEDLLDYDPSSLSGGYNQSKWVAEALVKAAMLCGQPATILRLGRVIGDSRSGRFDAADPFYALLATAIRTGKAPQTDAVLELTPVDYVARATLAITETPQALGRVFHLVNPKSTAVASLFDAVERHGHALKRVSLPEWWAHVRDHAADAPEGSLLAKLRPNIEGALAAAMTAQPAAPVRYGCERSVRVAAAAQVTCPELDDDAVGVALRQLAATGALPAASAAEPLPA